MGLVKYQREIKEKRFPGFLEYLKDYCLSNTSNRRKISGK